MKFGKYLEARQLELPEYNGHFINYKQLKKLIKQLSTNIIDNNENINFVKNSTNDDVLMANTNEHLNDQIEEEHIFSVSLSDKEKQISENIPIGISSLINQFEQDKQVNAPVYVILQTNKAHFFFKLERELEKVNDFYQEKENYFKSMLDILQKKFLEYKTKGRLTSKSSSSYKYLFESLKRFQKEIDHLTQFIDLNRTGFGKVLKKWDKRSHSHTKDFYLATVVSIQPIFTHSTDVALMTDLSTSLLLQLEEIREQAKFQGSDGDDDLTSKLQPMGIEYENNKYFLANSAIFGNTRVPSGSVNNSGNSPLEFNSYINKPEEFIVSIELEIDGWSKEIESISQLKDLEPRLKMLKDFPLKVVHFIRTYKTALNTSENILNSLVTRSLTKLCFLCVGNEKITDQCLQTFFNACNSLKNSRVDLLLLDNEDSYIFNKRNFFHEAAACKIQNRSFVFNAAIDLLYDNEMFLNYLLSQDVTGRTPLHYACELKKVQIVVRTIQLITQQREKLLPLLKIIDKSSNTPLLVAIKNNNEPIVDHLLKTFPDLEYHNDSSIAESKQLSPLNVACANTNYFIIKTVLENMFKDSKDISQYTDNQGYKPLHLSCENGADASILKLLCSYGCNPNEFDVVNKWTPLVYAVANDHKHTVISLINDCGCDISIGDSKKLTPLFYACWQGSVDMLNILLNKYKQDTRENNLKNSSQVSEGISRISNIANNKTSSSLNIPDVIAPPKPVKSGLLKPEATAFNLEDLENFKIGDSENIPDLRLPPPFIPLKKYGHNFLEKKFFLKLHFGADLSSIILNSEQTDTISLSNFGRITLTSNANDLISKNISLPIESSCNFNKRPSIAQTYTSSGTLRKNSLPNNAEQKTNNYAIKDLLSLGDSVDEAIFQLNDLDNCQIDIEIYPISGTKMIAKTVITYETIRNSMNQATNDGFIAIPLLDSRLKLMGQLCFDFHIISPFDNQLISLDVSQFETYWKSATNNESSSDGETTLTSSLSGEYLSLLVTLLNDGTIVVAPRLTVDVMGSRLLLLDLNKEQLEIFTQKKLDDVDELIQDFSCVGDYIQKNYLTLDALLKILPSNVKIDIKVCFPTSDEIRNVPVKVESPKVNIDTFVDDILNTVLAFVRITCGGSTKRIVFSSSNHMICSILNWKQPVFPVIFNMNGIILNKDYEFEMESQNHLLTQSIDKELFDSSGGFNYQSVKEVVNFSKNNNLLGVIIPTHLLLLCKELINEIKGYGLLIISGGISQSNADAQTEIKDDPLINGYKTNQYLVFKKENQRDNSKHNSNSLNFDFV
ncbi:SPX-domain-containing protein [Hanseniaspora valbyensis NRRL Y-1626]|uniref:SPX-domain-containing protein n=1 Tax=Hanseniaspora valbyensis NRRL Y-1626 TaxID=766949 RepID=A0A1B7TGQ8_9ASCO|nr:SPX-domain-containing protein [Hanseniaspora valbyensis NRRL Y-1626]